MTDQHKDRKDGGRPRSVELRDARALRALAHPTRLKLVGLLRLQGPLTATQAARELGETPQRCTFHLGQLAKYGLVEEAGGGRGRERPWRATASFTSWPNVLTEAEAAAAGQLLEAVVVEQHFEAVMEWIERKDAEPREWQQAARLNDAALYLTPGELEQLGRDIWSLFDPYLARAEDAGLRPEGSRVVTVLDLAFPRRSAVELPAEPTVEPAVEPPADPSAEPSADPSAEPPA
jgi:DNA-binding transcriptional ArsR family regulator